MAWGGVGGGGRLDPNPGLTQARARCGACARPTKSAKGHEDETIRKRLRGCEQIDYEPGYSLVAREHPRSA